MGKRVFFARGEIVDNAEIVEEVAKNSDGKRQYLCICLLCGARFVRQACRLAKHRSESCGCIRIAKTIEKSTTHGKSATLLYMRWQAMLNRCRNPKTKNYDIYGGRGIRVCQGWTGTTGFATWCADMGELPTPKHSIDRIKGNDNYSCGHCDECKEKGWVMNCRWATKTEQARNRSATRPITAFGVTKLLIEWAEYSGLNWHTIYIRIELGWTPEQALTTTDPKGNRLCAINGIPLEETFHKRTRKITAFGLTKRLHEWVKISGMKGINIHKRIKRGWSPEEAMTTPLLGSDHLTEAKLAVLLGQHLSPVATQQKGAGHAYPTENRGLAGYAGGGLYESFE